MKATELMIGDWVFVAEYDEYTPAPYNKPYPVQILHGADIDRADEISFEPIPLTPEILEKNGWHFEKYRTDYMVRYDLGVEQKNCWMHWAIGEHNLDILRQDEKLDFYNLCEQRVVIPCDYVHILQHALRLCGLEELADNFQI